MFRSVPVLSKFISKSARKRLPLTNKMAGIGFYKGNALMTKEGRHTSKGFKLDRSKMLEIKAPADFENFKLKPYVAPSVPKYPPREYDPDEN